MYIVPEREGVLHRRGEPRGETVSAFEARSERLVWVRAQTFPIPGDIPAVPGCRLSSVQVPTAGSTPLAPRRADRHVRVVGVPAADHQPGFALRERDDPLEKTHERPLIPRGHGPIPEHLRPGRGHRRRLAFPQEPRLIQCFELAVLVRAGVDQRLDEVVGAIAQLGRREVQGEPPAVAQRRRRGGRVGADRGPGGVRGVGDGRAARGERDPVGITRGFGVVVVDRRRRRQDPPDAVR